MKTRIYLMLLALLICGGLRAQTVTLPPSGDNQKTEIIQHIGALVTVTVTYSSPDVHSPTGDDRTGKIWGQLVPYGLTDLGFGLRNPAPWRAGANENTTIAFSHDVLVEGKPLKAGTYGFHIIAKEEGSWTLIFSNNYTSWGSYFYDETEDALRVEVTPRNAPYHEWLDYEFIDRQPESATLALQWENLEIPFTIEVPNIKELYMANLKRELNGAAGFNWQNWNAAATYAYQNDADLEQALRWADMAINAPFVGQENFTTLSTKANILSKMGREDEAMAVMDQAINHPTATPFQIHAYGRQLITAGKSQQALKVFQTNAKLNKDEWPVNVGLARGYSAVGDYKKALKYAEIAYKNAPDQLNKNSLADAIQKLKKNEDIN